MSTSPRLDAVHVGTPARIPYGSKGKQRTTSIGKTSVTGPVRVHGLGLDGDQVADLRWHGGPYQAVYAYGTADYDWWAAQLGGPVPPGTFGENLTVSGLDVNGAVLGETWRIGEVLLQVVDVRIPCNTFKDWMGLRGFDARSWVKRFTLAGRPGPYLRVLEEGTLQAGDRLDVVDVPAHGVTVLDMFRALTTETHRLPRLLEVDVVAPRHHDDARAWLARNADGVPAIG